MIKVIQGESVKDGAGVKLNRVIGTRSLDNANPFLLLDEFRSDNKDDYIAGFPMHPHRGMETITYMLEGSFIHRDSNKNEGKLNPGEVQWMTAGKGIRHEEMPAMDNGKLWGYQLWVNLPKKYKMVNPQYRHLKKNDIPVIKDSGIVVKIISGIYNNTESNLKTYLPVDYMDVYVNGGIFKKELKEVNLVYVHSGEIKISTSNETVSVSSKNMALIEDEKSISIEGNESGFLFISADKLDEPIAKYGPFVMNTMDEILQAIDDFNNGQLDK